jgi:cyclic nucleotide gated channel
MQRNEIPVELKRKIIKSIKKKLEEDKDANLENLFNILPWDTRKDLKRFLCMKALINVCSSKLPRTPSLPLYILCIINV